MLRITVSNERQRKEFTHAGGPLELGRGPKVEHERFIVEDRFVSRNQLRIHELGPSKIRLENLGGPTTLADGSTMPRSETRELRLPVRLTIGYTMIEIANDAVQSSMASGMQTIDRPLHSMAGSGSETSISSLGAAPSPETLLRWFETLISVQRTAAGSEEFYQETAGAVVRLVGLDRGMVLLRRGTQWEVAACHPPEDCRSREFSQRVVAQVLESGQTYFEEMDQEVWTQSLVGIESVVASPIFDDRPEVIGVVYGSRDLVSKGARRGIQKLEAHVVQLLAGIVSAGLARVEREKEATRNRLRFEQFSSPKLARALESNPSLLEAHEREVTVMFCDVRDFSEIAEQIGTRDSFALLADAMDLLTEKILNYDGIVIDYAGDGVFSMWNAPEDQNEHAEMACRSALGMLDIVPQLNEKWAKRIGRPIRIGVGVNTGPAQVGNAGSRQRLKYGPRGSTVNMASRVEGTTKVFRVPVLITESTSRILPETFYRRRLCRVCVKGIGDAVTLYELHGDSPDEHWIEARDIYERALAEYESGRWQEARRLLESLAKHPQVQDDYPREFLMKFATKYCESPPQSFNPVFELKSK